MKITNTVCHEKKKKREQCLQRAKLKGIWTKKINESQMKSIIYIIILFIYLFNKISE